LINKLKLKSEKQFEHFTNSNTNELNAINKINKFCANNYIFINLDINCLQIFLKYILK